MRVYNPEFLIFKIFGSFSINNCKIVSFDFSLSILFTTEVITNNAKVFCNIPLTIPYNETLTIRGEAVIKYSTFNEINAKESVNLRIVPELQFEIDDSAAYGANIDRLIASLHKGENDG